MNDEWLLYLLTGFVAGILIIKTSPIWIVGYQWLKTLKMIPSKLKRRYSSYVFKKKAQEKNKWIENKDLCTTCGSGFASYLIRENRPFAPHWGVGRYCLNPETSHYWISQQGMTKANALVLYKKNIAELKERKNEND